LNGKRLIVDEGCKGLFWGHNLIPKKIGRNDPCWCGSGIKYKKCHLDRESQKPVESWELFKEFRDKYSFQKCSAPKSMLKGCSGKIVKAHTIPKSTSLKSIAKNGHVYGLSISLNNIFKHKGKLRPQLMGVNKASTFSGFCDFHDNEIFSPIEKHEFSVTAENCFLLSYRALAREYYTKSAMANLSQSRKSLDRGKSIDRQMEIQTKAFLMDIGAQAGVRDSEHHKSLFDSCLESQSYESVRALILELDAPPPIMVSGAVSPDFDFDGNRIQDLMELERVPDIISITSFYDGNTGRIVFSWLENSSKSCVKLIESFLRKPKKELNKHAVQYIFNNFENCFISPDWWDNLKEGTKEEIVDSLSNIADLESYANGEGFKRANLDIEFPSITAIIPVNWDPSI
jgi:SEC-C motif